MRKYIIMAALMAVFFFALTSMAAAYTEAEPTTQEEDETSSESAPEQSETPPVQPPVPEEMHPEHEPEWWETTQTPPPGTGTVVDVTADPDDKAFYTIMTPDGNVFYLVIDRRHGRENVHFLNPVTEQDLLALIGQSDGTEPPEPPTPEPPPVTPPPPPSDLESIPTPEPTPEPSNGGNTGSMLLLLLAVLGVGGAGWYFKIYRPKQQGAAFEEEDDFDYFDEPAEEDDIPWTGTVDDILEEERQKRNDVH